MILHDVNETPKLYSEISVLLQSALELKKCKLNSINGAYLLLLNTAYVL